MEGEDRRLDRKRDEEAEENPVFDETPESTSENVPCESPKTMIDASISSDPAIV